MPGPQPEKRPLEHAHAIRAHAKRRVQYSDIILLRFPEGIQPGVAEATDLDGVSPAKWPRRRLLRRLEASRKKRARRGAL